MTSPLIGSTSRFRDPGSLRNAILTQSGTPFAEPHIEPLARPDGTETERRLERELLQVLSRPPAKRSGGREPSGPLAAIEPEEPQPSTVLFVGAHFQNPEEANPSGHSPSGHETDAARSGSLSDLDEFSPDVEVESRNTNWLKTARRARRNRTLRLAGSWIITILVGGFIILVAAAILFGFPAGSFALREQAVLAATPEFDASGHFPELAPTRWHLDDQ